MKEMAVLEANIFGTALREKTGREEIDLLLVRRCAAGDSAALREIVCCYQGRLCGFLAQMLGSREDAEEALQDVFLRVWQQAGRFQGRASFSTWLYRIAANVAYDMLRRRKVQAGTISLADAPMPASADAQVIALDALEREVRSRHLRQALCALRPEDRLVLVLYYAEELSYEEICAITGHSYPVLKVRLMRARQRLRAVMEAMTPSEEAE